MNARSRAQKDAAWVRAFHSQERVEWVQARPSAASGKGPCENAHVKSGGTSRRADYIWIVPLTFDEHRKQLHQHGHKTFEARYGIVLLDEAARTQAEWLEYLRETTRPSW